MPRASSYLFLELALLVYLIGFGLQPWVEAPITSRRTLYAAIALGMFWFAIDEVALALRIWSFPEGGTLHLRVFGLPLEEYLLFFLHTVVCLVLIQQDRRVAR